MSAYGEKKKQLYETHKKALKKENGDNCSKYNDVGAAGGGDRVNKELDKEYDLEMKNGTRAKVNIKIEVSAYEPNDKGELLSKVASSSRNFYLELAGQLTN